MAFQGRQEKEETLSLFDPPAKAVVCSWPSQGATSIPLMVHYQHPLTLNMALSCFLLQKQTQHFQEVGPKVTQEMLTCLKTSRRPLHPHGVNGQRILHTVEGSQGSVFSLGLGSKTSTEGEMKRDEKN